ncbi:MAG: TldD/PmbA family protein [Nitrospirae bacterium]|nr:MAG: TldD/PmbA family protein [Nitrospirota bacterium]
MKTNREFASRIVELALKKGADQAEAYIKSSKNLSLEVKNFAVDAIESSLGFGYSLRVIKDGRLGFSYSTSADEMESVVKSATESADWTDRDEYLDLPSGTGNLKHDIGKLEIFDKEAADLKEDDAINHVLSIEKAAKDFDDRIKKTRKASGTFSSGEILILNSKGIDISYPYTKAAAQVITVAEENNEAQMGWDADGSRFLSDISFKNIGINAAKRAVQLLGSKKITTTKAPVILDSSVAAEFLGVFASSLSAESVQKGRSLLKGKTGRKIISSNINLIDSGLMQRRLGTRPFDDEGVATSEKVLIKEGVLQGQLHNTYTAKKDGVRSTGNAVRGGYTGLPAVGITNLYINAVSGSDIIPFNSLINSIDKGLYITEAMGVHTANPISGEFSVGVSGLWIENGAIKFPVKEAVISGNILGLFEKIKAIGDDVRFYGGIGSPSLLIGPTDISA